jgi:hypothetical protein
MRKTYLAAAAGLLAFSASPASASLFLFTQGGFEEGATITGSFVGADTDLDGQISAFDGEVTDFTAAFSGNSLIGPLAFTFADLFGLVYDLDGDIGDGLTLDMEGIRADDGATFYAAGPGPLAACDGITTCGLVGDGQNESGTIELVFVTLPIPEPGTWAMMLLGFGAVGLSLRRRKRPAASPQLA